MTRKFALSTIIVIVAVGIGVFGYMSLDSNKKSTESTPLSFQFAEDQGVQYMSKTDQQSFYIYRNSNWEKTFVKGVNIGAGKPGAFPGELAISYEEYYRWFGYISEMNANTIRVYTILRPQFYNALYDFNQAAERAGHDPIYVIHGVWINENDIVSIEDTFGQDDKILNDTIKSGQDIIDIIHGRHDLPVRKGHADGTYTSDISRYVMGWILGIEWEPALVVGTNEHNPDRASYDGQYLYTVDASPFEAFLAQLGDELISYEMTRYSMQRPVAFSNWVTTDPLEHPYEPYINEDLVEVNVEHVKWHDTYKPGMFVSYHVYPYYPDSFSYQHDYVEYVDEDGKVNPYRAYLEDIKKVHSMPIVISELGIPASRGKAHENIVTGYNQGFVDEKSQGEMILHMMNDIDAARLAGGLVFSWQDEWFKRTWNNSDLDMSDHRPFWLNAQTNEQHFGLLAMDPGTDQSISYVDGKVDDWSEDKPIYTSDEMKLYIKSDEGYVYLRVESDSYDFSKDTLIIPFDTIADQGNDQFAQFKTNFSDAADFVLQIHGQNDSRLMVDAYYDNYYFRHAILSDYLKQNEAYHHKNSGIFNPIQLALTREMHIPIVELAVPFTGYETGVLKYGISNPDSDDFDSLSDFYYDNGNLEIRIPWQLLNVMDPSQKYVINDMFSQGKITPLQVNGFNVGIARIKGGLAKSEQEQTVSMSEYHWEAWDIPTFHERLKPSYYILKNGFQALGARK
ncbi:MAG: family 2 glycosyl transferase [Candidatus Cohnella colombiensis]|uniref:Family 2 glycosyl transferase n=1 Tax=Candidatus Cohnella colombiensis TaxID=3121368 RepID=A0AA95F3F3_9BACL|nr:MAG: family 2 glycosyl transferase [Cohnella sp.]